MAELLVSQPLDLEASLMGGQAHRWRQEGEWYSGMVRGNFIKIRQLSPFPPFRVPCYAAPSPPLTRQGGTSPLSLTTFSLTKGGTTSSLPPDRGGIKGGVRLEFHCEPWPEASVAPLLHSYFRLDEDINTIYADICRDVRVEAMVARYPGLRVLRQEPWECLIAFICSSNSNIPRIARNLESLATQYGSSVVMGDEVRYAFPTPLQLALAGEKDLRKLGLGFRAPFVFLAAQDVFRGELDLDALSRMPYLEAKARLMECHGIGTKIADCVAVFSLEKLEAFPIDVWVRRALGEWYFPGQKVPPDRVLLEWAQDHFGPYAGYAQQYLFHGRRLEG